MSTNENESVKAKMKWRNEIKRLVIAKKFHEMFQGMYGKVSTCTLVFFNLEPKVCPFRTNETPYSPAPTSQDLQFFQTHFSDHNSKQQSYSSISPHRHSQKYAVSNFAHAPAGMPSVIAENNFAMEIVVEKIFRKYDNCLRRFRLC